MRGGRVPGPAVPGEGRTLPEVLRGISAAMDAADEEERRAADPLAAVIAARRRSLLGRMLYGRGR